MDAWGKGGVPRLGTVTYKSARYCADYIGKAHSIVEYRSGLAKPFIVMSQGIGRAYVDSRETELAHDLGVTVEGVHVGLPRYYIARIRGNAVRRMVKEGVPRLVAVERARAAVGHRGFDEPLPEVALHRVPMGQFVPPGIGDVLDGQSQAEATAAARLGLFKKGRI